MQQKATWVLFHTRTKTRRYRVFSGAVLGQHMCPSIVRPDWGRCADEHPGLVHTSINSRHDLIRRDLVCATPRNAVQRDGEVEQNVLQEHERGRSQK